MTVHFSARSPRRILAVTVGGLGLVALVAGAGLAAPVASAPAAAPEMAAAPVSLPAEQTSVGLGCWVTGDMVWSPEGSAPGDPAAMARAVCGGK